MKTAKTTAVLLMIFIFFSCDVFLGSDADSSPEGVLYSLWKTFKERHAYVEIKMDMNPNFDSWEEVYLHYNNLLSRGMNLFHACGGMLNELNDPHVYLYDNQGQVITVNDSAFSYSRSRVSSEWTIIFSTAREFLIDQGTIAGSYNLMYGSFKKDPSIGYLYISGFEERFIWEERLDSIIDYFNKNSKALIVDIRYNFGGLAPVEEFIASRFASVQANYIMASVKNGPGYNDFSNPSIFKVRPAANTYTKPVVLLTNKASISAAEWFTLAMRTQPHVIHVGTNTGGALSLRTMHPMINGWFYSISAYKITDMSGRCYEGFGVTPHLTITGDEDPSWIVNPATQLEEVYEWFTKWLENPQGDIK